MESERRKFGMVLIFTVIFATLAFVSVGCAAAATHYVNLGESIQVSRWMRQTLATPSS